MRSLFRCPEAAYWKRGDVVMVGKGERAWMYRVIRKESQSVAIVEYVRSL